MQAQPPESPAARFLGVRCGSHPIEVVALGQVLDALEARIRTVWEGSPPCLDGFWTELGRCVPEVESVEALITALSELHVEDLHLAFASRCGDGRALERFEDRHIHGLARAIASVDPNQAFVDEVRQRLRTRLLVPDGLGVPKLAHYRGEGPLQAWLQVVAVREAITLLRRERRGKFISEDALLEHETTVVGPELHALKHESVAEFRASFQAALDGLTPEQRNLLRLHYFHGLTVDELGRMLGIHRSSAARRVVKARDQLLRDTRNELRRRLTVVGRDVDEVIALAQSRLDLSIERLLDPGGSGPGGLGGSDPG